LPHCGVSLHWLVCLNGIGNGPSATLVSHERPHSAEIKDLGTKDRAAEGRLRGRQSKVDDGHRSPTQEKSRRHRKHRVKEQRKLPKEFINFSRFAQSFCGQQQLKRANELIHTTHTGVQKRWLDPSKNNNNIR